jgi:hypothetical protein
VRGAHASEEHAATVGQYDALRRALKEAGAEVRLQPAQASRYRRL